MTNEFAKDLLSKLIDDDLADLNAGVTMPDDLHGAWAKRVEAEEMEQKSQKKALKSWLAAAAVLVFVVGGTWFSRGNIPMGTNNADVNQDAGYGDGYEYDYDYGGFYEYESQNDNVAGAMPSATQQPMLSRTALTGAPNEAASETKLIKSVTMDLSTLTFDEALKAIETALAKHGGYVAYQSQDGQKAGKRRADFTLRVPKDALDAFVAEMKGIGVVSAVTQSATDVTDSYQDSVMRLQTQQAKMDRLQAMITETATLTELLQLENEIAQTQYTLDSLNGSLQSLNKQVDYAQVSITLREEMGAEAIPNTDLSIGERLKQGLSASMQGIVTLFTNGVVALVAALPFILIAAFAIVVTVIIRRRRKK